MEEREMSVWLNTDFHEYKKLVCMKSIQETNFKLISTMGDDQDELIAEINTLDSKIRDSKNYIVVNRMIKKEIFNQMTGDDIESVMSMHYLSYLTFEQIAEKLNYHVSSVKRKHIDGLSQACKIVSKGVKTCPY